jgi:predicted aconitase
MSSLKAVYQSIVQQDQVKLAQVRYERGEVDTSNVDPGLLKQAQDYDHIGRILAHNVFADMLKTALDETAPAASDEEKAKALAALLAAANGEATAHEGKETPAEEKKEEEEKKASVKHAILQRMSQDPEYVSALVGKYYGR